ncbi:MAG TPA: hypothetical protein VHC98_03120 [Candidatus Saccharimonadales bacterium]|nr:hypothetical protein [Candidatus Saccharimonadales bacterium]
MRIRYETGVATLVQFIGAAGLSFLGGLASIAAGCSSGANADCVTNAFVSLVFIILMIGALAFLVLLGYSAQARRSTRLALMLVIAELLALGFFLFDAKQAPDIVERITNALSALLAVWVILVALRLANARGQRIVNRPRRRRSS